MNILNSAEQFTEKRLYDLFDKLEIDEELRKHFLEANTELRLAYKDQCMKRQESFYKDIE